MKLSAEEVAKIARLARLKLTPEETKRFQEQLSEVLVYMEQLNEVNTVGVEPTAQVTGLQNVLADDMAKDSGIQDELLALSPETEKTSIKVPPVFGDGHA